MNGITGGKNPHVNYEPSTMGGLSEADRPSHDEPGPVRDLPPLPTQQLSEAEQDRLQNLGKNGPRM